MNDISKLMEQAMAISKMMGQASAPNSESNAPYAANEEESTVNNGNDMAQFANMVEMMRMIQSMSKPISSENDDNINAKKEFEDETALPVVKIMKSAIPFMDGAQAKNITIAVKVVELFDVMQHYDIAAMGLETSENKQKAMLMAVKEHMNTDKQHMIDMLVNIIDMTEILQKMERMNKAYGKRF